MADTAVAITAGSGTNIDTRTEATNGNHRQVVVVGDPSTNAGVAPVDATAGLKVDLGADNDVTVSGVSTLAEQQTQTTHLATIAGDTTDIEAAVELLDDTVYTDGSGTVTKGIAILGQDGTNPQAIKTDSSGELQVDVLTMPTVAVTQSGTWDEVGINDSGNSITVDNAQLSVVGSGTEAAAMRVTIATDSTGVLSVDDNDSSLTVDNAHLTSLGGAISGTEVQVDVVGALPAGTNAIGKLAANSGVDIGDVDITSIAAGDNNIGNVDIASIAAGDNNIGNVDVVTLPALAAGTNAIGKVLPTDQDVTAHTNYAKKYYTSAGAATDGIIWSPAAGKRWHITSIYIQVSAAATVTLEDDKAGGDEAIWKGELAANSGAFMTFDPLYPWASGEDAADLIITTTAGNVYVTVVGYEI